MERLTPKIPPHNLQVEQVILGGCLMNARKIPIVADLVAPSDFYREAHEHIAEAIFDLGKDADLMTVSEWLRKTGRLEKAGGDEYLGGLLESTVTSAGIEKHCAIVQEYSRRRQVISAAEMLSEEAYQDHCELDLMLTDHAKILHDIQQQGFKDYEEPEETIARAYELIKERNKSGKEIVGILTGFSAIDDHLHGLEPKNTYYLKALSKTGKSSLALNICGNILQSYKGQIPYFTLESTKLALTLRRLARRSNIPLTRLRIGKIYDEGEWQRLTEAVNSASRNLLLIDSPQFQTFEKIVSFCTALSNHEKILLVVIDFLQLLHTSHVFQSLHEMYRYISNQLNFLAKDLDCPVLALSQVVESGESRGKAKESRDIENSADHVWMLKRDDFDQPEAKIIGEKAKDDPVWQGDLYFDQNVMKWRDYAGGQQRYWQNNV